MRFTERVYRELLNSPACPPETGGILGGDGVTIDCRVMDRSVGGEDTYSPDAAFLNRAAAAWCEAGRLFMGMFHTHPEGCRELSRADIRYINRIVQAFGAGRYLYFPVVIPQKEIIGFRAEKRNDILILRDEIQIG